MVGWLVGRSVGRLVGWLAGWLAVWLVDCPLKSIGRLTYWLIDRSLSINKQAPKFIRRSRNCLQSVVRVSGVAHLGTVVARDWWRAWKSRPCWMDDVMRWMGIGGEGEKVGHVGWGGV